jgi:hypothetical protein
MSRSIRMVRWLASLPAAIGLALPGSRSAAADEPPAPRPMMVSEAKLPQGFPGPGPVGSVVVKIYPPHRLARATVGGAADNTLFMKLFNHIKRNDIAMTAPVQMDGKRESMAFLYATPGLGAPGPDPKDPAVVVEDIPETTVASVGVRGSYSKATAEAGVKQLREWLAAHPEWQPTGDPRTLGYNSPFVPSFLKYSEVQIPVRAVPQ